MKLSELIDAAVEAERNFGDVPVAFVAPDENGENQMSFMDVCVAKVEGQIMFTFMVLDSENAVIQ